MPQICKPIDDGEDPMWGYDPVSLIPVLVNAVKTLASKNDTLTSRITALEAAQTGAPAS